MKNLSAQKSAWQHNNSMLFLTDQERTQLKAQHKRERDKRICDRIKAVLLADEGWAPQQIAKVLLISDQAVREHVQEYKTVNKLKPESGGSEEKLSEEQSKRLTAHLEVYPNHFKIWFWAILKLSKFVDLNRLNINNIRSIKIGK